MDQRPETLTYFEASPEGPGEEGSTILLLIISQSLGILTQFGPYAINWQTNITRMG